MRSRALIALAQLRHNVKNYRGAHELASAAYFRSANLFERRGEVQRSLGALKRA